MLFLMNDVVLELAAEAAPAPARTRALTLAHVLKLGAELYAERPLLHREEPERAARLALLIKAKAPAVNAALFVAPALGCSPQAVATRVAELSLELICGLQDLARRDALNPVTADREVWRRLAA